MHQEESYVRESINDSDAKITQKSKFLVRCKTIFTILNQGAALEQSTFPIKPPLL